MCCTCRVINPVQNKINSLKRDFILSVILLKLLNCQSALFCLVGFVLCVFVCLGFVTFLVIAYFDASPSNYRIKSISIVSKMFKEFKSEVNILSNCLKLTKQGNLWCSRLNSELMF